MLRPLQSRLGAWLGILLFACGSVCGSQAALLHFQATRLVETPPGSDHWKVVVKPLTWQANRTAVVICDMWNQHWCKGATKRVREMAPRMNEVISALRRQGVLIIHCPSDCMAYYRNTPERKLAESAPPVNLKPILQRYRDRVPRNVPPLPIDDSDGGCDDTPQCKQGSPWTHENDLLKIKPGDAITDSLQAYYLMHERGITNVIIMGVHQNMCILNRPFGIEQMVKLGQNVVLMRDLTDTMYNHRRKPYVNHFIGTVLVRWYIEKYWCPTISSDQILGGSPFRFPADTLPTPVFHNYVKMPVTQSHWKRVAGYVERTPNPDYRQAPDSAREAFRDLKFGVRIHWGVYAIWHISESWPLLGMSNVQRQEYQELYHDFNPVDFNAAAWMKLFRRAGIKLMAFTSRHHDGFSLFDTKARVRERVNWTAPGGPKLEACDTTYSVMDSPYHRDIVKELCNAAHRYGIKIDLYYSLPDWYDADFRPYAVDPVQVRNGARYGVHPGETNGILNPLIAPDPTPKEQARMIGYIRTQLTELLTHYGKIDMIGLDQWLGPHVWLPLRATIKYARSLQPDVMFRARGIGNYGDYYTPERYVPGAPANTSMPWMVIYPLGGMWSYQPDASKYHDGAWIIRNLIDIVAKGGNFMVGIGPDERGLFHPKAVAALDYAGRWLRVNGQAIYATRPRAAQDWKEGKNIRFTRSKDHRTLYAIALSWPGRHLTLATVRANPGSEVRLLGYSEPLTWHNDATRGLVIDLPADLQSPAHRPCPPPAYAFRIEGQTRP